MSATPERKIRRVAWSRRVIEVGRLPRAAWSRRVIEVARLPRAHGALCVEVVDRHGQEPIVAIRFEHPDGRPGGWSEFQLTELGALEEAIALARDA